MHYIPDSILQSYLTEDAPYGDLTTHGLGLDPIPTRITYSARNAMTVCGSEEAERMLAMLGATTKRHVVSGTTVEAGTLLLEAEAPANAIMTAWKVTQNLMEWTSGIASSAHAIVTAAREVAPYIVVACTRKSAPGTRPLSLKAICNGGATPHRCGLSDTILIFPEHLALLPSQEEQHSAIAALKRKTPERSVVIEVKTKTDALAACDLGVDVIQLEKFPPEQTKDLMATLQQRENLKRPIIALAGGVNPQNAANHAATGVDVLVTSFPYTARPADVQVQISRA